MVDESALARRLDEQNKEPMTANLGIKVGRSTAVVSPPGEAVDVI